MTPTPSLRDAAQALKPCPFCGAGETMLHVNKGTWNGQRYGEPVSVEVRHWCEPEEGQPARMVARVGRDEASAIAAWNRRAALSAPADALAEPVATASKGPVAFFVKWTAAGAQLRGKFDLYTATQFQQAVARERESILDEWADRMQADLEHGIRSLNERAAAEFNERYPQLAGFAAAIRAKGQQ